MNNNHQNQQLWIWWNLWVAEAPPSGWLRWVESSFWNFDALFQPQQLLGYRGEVRKSTKKRQLEAENTKRWDVGRKFDKAATFGIKWAQKTRLLQVGLKVITANL